MHKISTWLWFDGQAEEAAQFYTSVFDDSRILSTQYFGPDMPGEDGSVLAVTFELFGSRFGAINGGPEFTFNEAASIYVACESQDEVDKYWSMLTADGGEEGPCGWLKDKYGVSWQIIPSVLETYTTGDDQERANRVMQAVLTMKKIDVAALDAAYRGE